MKHLSLPRCLYWLSGALLLSFAGTSCKSTKAENTEYPEYAAPTDSGYNPYQEYSPSSSGSTAASSTSSPSYAAPQYATYTPPKQSYTPPADSTPAEYKPEPEYTPPPKKKTASTSTAKKKSTPAKKKSSGGYTVKQGDTLYSIARRNNTTVAKIKARSGISSDLIRPGQKLSIP